MSKASIPYRRSVRKLRSVPLLEHPQQPDWPAILQKLRQGRLPLAQIAAFCYASREHISNVMAGITAPSFATGQRLLQLHTWLLSEEWREGKGEKP